jgi:uncharacterized protein (DUF736 family)
MSKQYDDTNTFSLFVNEKGNDAQPDYTGKVNVDGRELRLAGWKKESKKGVKYLSGRVSEFQKQETPKADPVDDVVPF